MSKYKELYHNPPKLKITGKPRQVKINLVSCMCDNEYRWTFNRELPDGDYDLCTHGYAYSNFQIKLREKAIKEIIGNEL